MADTIIQIKRSTTTAVPTALEAGELAFTSNGDSLWVGSPAGTNTANVIHIGSKISYFANSSQLGSTAGGSNTELASTYAIKGYVDGRFNSYSTTLDGLDDVDTASKANNNILVYDANSGKWENHTVSGTNNEVEVTFSGQDITVGLPNAVTITTSLGVGSNVNLSTSGISVGNATVNTQITSTGITANGANITSVNAATVGSNTAGDLRGYSDTVAATAYSNAVSVAAADATTKAATAYSNAISYADTKAATAYSNAVSVAATDASTKAATAYSNAVSVAAADASTKAGTAYSNAVAFAANADNISSGTLATARLPATANIATQINVGANVNLTTTSISVGNSSVNTSLTSSAITTGTVTTSGLANLHSANITNNVAIGGTLNAGNTTITGLLTVSGNLNVTGTLTTIDTQNVVIEDSLIRLARNQANTGTFTDSVDIGLYGVYGNTSAVRYTGLARDSSSNAYVLFDGKTVSPDNNGVSTSDTLSTLYAFLNSGALTTNTSTVAITANSTVNVAIVANTLTLSTALGVASGGTGRATLTTNAILVGNSAGAVTQLSSSTQGHVLQINGSGAPVFGGLDGGSF